MHIVQEGDRSHTAASFADERSPLEIVAVGYGVLLANPVIDTG